MENIIKRSVSGYLTGAALTLNTHVINLGTFYRKVYIKKMILTTSRALSDGGDIEFSLTNDYIIRAWIDTGLEVVNDSVTYGAGVTVTHMQFNIDDKKVYTFDSKAMFLGSGRSLILNIESVYNNTNFVGVLNIQFSFYVELGYEPFK